MNVPLRLLVVLLAMLCASPASIPADAKHPGNAHRYIDYLLRPDVAVRNTNVVNYANANLKATELVNEEIRSDPGIYPPAETKARLQPNLTKSAEFTRLLNRAWTRFTTGR